MTSHSLPLYWRKVVAQWSIPKREAWGILANNLAESGTPWPEDEYRAFEAIRLMDFPDDDPSPPITPEFRGSDSGRLFD